MQLSTSSFVSTADALEVVTRRWTPDGGAPVGVVQLAHGVAEHSLRYARLAEALVDAGYVVYAHDHRGHGGSVGGDVELGSFGAAGWPALVDDVVTFTRVIRDEQSNLPIFLVAHSMGSFAAQQVILDHSDLYRGVVLVGSTALDVLGQALAASGGPVELTAFNAPFEQRTGYEWLSRDEAEVDAYVADPLSGFDLAEETIPRMFEAAPRLADPEALVGVRKDLPILILSGQDDPLSGGGDLSALLAQRYRDAGVADVTLHVEPGARHELFNETNRDEITALVVDWLRAHA